MTGLGKTNFELSL